MPRKSVADIVSQMPDEPPVQAVPDPILCTPYEAPHSHWIYQHGAPQVLQGRRAAGYYYTTERSGSAQANLFEQGFDELALVNALRADVGRWRAAGYRGATEVTKELLRHWTDSGRERRLFFCQVEAVETLIYLMELRLAGRSARTGFQNFELTDDDVQRLLKGEAPRNLKESGTKRPPTFIDASSDPDMLPLRRLGCKMATGSGKTVVMAMLIAWAFCNRNRNPMSREFPSGVLVCAPNLTVRNRLAVLRPEDPGNYYQQFNIVPGKYMEAIRAGKVLVTNWHVFAAKSPSLEGGVSYRVVDKGEEDNGAFARARLGELIDRLPLLVLNDEGHHCWRPKQADDFDDADLSAEEKAALKDEMNEARVWLDGLDRINSSGLNGSDGAGHPNPSVIAAVDLSATPFYLAGSGYPEGSPFPWLVSDFGLVDAIESGIVKIPRIPVKHVDAAGNEVAGGAGRPDPEFYRLWDHAIAQLTPQDRVGRNRWKSEAIYRVVENALATLYSQWKAQFQKYLEAERNQTQEVIPPVMIIVCPDTDVARYFYEQLSGERTIGEGKDARTVWESTKFPEFANGASETVEAMHTVRIDSELLKALAGDEDASKDDKIRQRREIIDTIGKPGKPGGKVRCVVSVSMLTEGWDANNVTQILGVRPFRSQLLCEQVVGRGLRRRSYRPDESGKLGAEHVDVYGIPFSLIPFKGAETDKEPKPDVPPNHIFAVSSRDCFAIDVPNVAGYRYRLNENGVSCDFDRIVPMELHREPSGVMVQGVRGYRQDPEVGVGSGLDLVRQDASKFLETVHPQRIAMELTQAVVKDLDTQQNQRAETERVAMNARMFADVFAIVNRFIREKVRLRSGEDIRTLAYERNMLTAKERLVTGVQAGFTGNAQERLVPRLYTLSDRHRSAEVNETTRKRVYRVVKSHVNAFAYGSDTEIRIADALDWSPHVRAWLPNVRGGFDFRIPYEFEDNSHDYRPDFVVSILTPEGQPPKHLLLEVKGGGGEVWGEERVRSKDAAAQKWCTAVNNHGGFGHWEFLKAYSVEEVEAALARMAGAPQEKAPFLLVHPTRADKWKGCVPKMPFAVAAGMFLQDGAAGETGDSLFADDTIDWVSWEGMPSVSKGWFVCRVSGTSMAPKIPDHAWCLFRPFSGDARDGKLLLVSHREISEVGQPVGLTLKRYRSERLPESEGGPARVRVSLEPLNTDGHDPIVIEKADEDQVRVVAEFVQVIK